MWNRWIRLLENFSFAFHSKHVRNLSSRLIRLNRNVWYKTNWMSSSFLTWCCCCSPFIFLLKLQSFIIFFFFFFLFCPFFVCLLLIWFVICRIVLDNTLHIRAREIPNACHFSSLASSILHAWFEARISRKRSRRTRRRRRRRIKRTRMICKSSVNGDKDNQQSLGLMQHFDIQYDGKKNTWRESEWNDEEKIGTNHHIYLWTHNARRKTPFRSKYRFDQ